MILHDGITFSSVWDLVVDPPLLENKNVKSMLTEHNQSVHQVEASASSPCQQELVLYHRSWAVQEINSR